MWRYSFFFSGGHVVDEVNRHASNMHFLHYPAPGSFVTSMGLRQSPSRVFPRVLRSFVAGCQQRVVFAESIAAPSLVLRGASVPAATGKAGSDL